VVVSVCLFTIQSHTLSSITIPTALKLFSISNPAKAHVKHWVLVPLWVKLVALFTLETQPTAMTEREIAITLIVLISVVSILTTPFMMMKRGSARLATPQKRSPWAGLWSSPAMWPSPSYCCGWAFICTKPSIESGL
jgi:hypothetical protein